MKKFNIRYSIQKIHTTKFSFEELDEGTLIALLSKVDGSHLEVTINLSVDKEKSTITLDINSQFKHPDTKANLVEHTGRTVFIVDGLEQIYNKETNSFDLPNDLVEQLYFISYSHSRALLAVSLSPTIYKDRYFLPLVDPSTVISRIRNSKNKKSPSNH